MFKKVFAMLALMLFTYLFYAGALQARQVDVFVDGEVAQTYAIMQDDATLVSIGHISEVLGGNARWDNDTRQVSVYAQEVYVIFTVDGGFAIVDGYHVGNGQVFIINDRAFATANLINQIFDINVRYFDDAVHITTPAHALLGTWADWSDPVTFNINATVASEFDDDELYTITWLTIGHYLYIRAYDLYNEIEDYETFIYHIRGRQLVLISLSESGFGGIDRLSRISESEQAFFGFWDSVGSFEHMFTYAFWSDGWGERWGSTPYSFINDFFAWFVYDGYLHIEVRSEDTELFTYSFDGYFLTLQGTYEDAQPITLLSARANMRYLQDERFFGSWHNHDTATQYIFFTYGHGVAIFENTINAFEWRTLFGQLFMEHMDFTEYSFEFEFDNGTLVLIGQDGTRTLVQSDMPDHEQLAGSWICTQYADVIYYFGIYNGMSGYFFRNTNADFDEMWWLYGNYLYIATLVDEVYILASYSFTLHDDALTISDTTLRLLNSSKHLAGDWATIGWGQDLFLDEDGLGFFFDGYFDHIVFWEVADYSLHMYFIDWYTGELALHILQYELDDYTLTVHGLPGEEDALRFYPFNAVPSLPPATQGLEGAWQGLDLYGNIVQYYFENGTGIRISTSGVEIFDWWGFNWLFVDVYLIDGEPIFLAEDWDISVSSYTFRKRNADAPQDAPWLEFERMDLSEFSTISYVELVGAWGWDASIEWQYTFNADGTGTRGWQFGEHIDTFMWQIDGDELILTIISYEGALNKPDITVESWHIHAAPFFISLNSNQVDGFAWRYFRVANSPLLRSTLSALVVQNTDYEIA